MKIKNQEEVLVRIYELRDPRDLECKPRYVGITTNTIENRLKGHLNKTQLKRDTYKDRWIKKLIRNGILPTIHLIEEVIGWNYACEVEKYYIKEFRDQGYKLTNSTDGGEGTLGIVFTKEQIERCKFNNGGERNPMYGKYGKDNPLFGRKTPKESIDKRVNSTKKTLSSKGQVGSIGITKGRSGKWVVRGGGGKIKTTINLGNYVDLEDAINVRKMFMNKKYALDTELTPEELIKLGNEIRLSYKLLIWAKRQIARPPCIGYIEATGKWRVRITFNRKDNHLGCYDTIEDAIKRWYKEVDYIKELIKNNTLNEANNRYN